MQLPYRFGRYVLTQRIAQGGMAEIFKAKYLGESGFSKDVAIKRLLPGWSENREFINMLIDEAKALVHLSHPNIVQVFELGRDHQTFYISMEWVEGLDLQAFHFPIKFVLFIIAEVLKALDYAHHKKDENGHDLKLVHRDISPQNILISYEGHVKVADFGIAKGSHRSHETAQAQVKGKYAYMSPEQARGETVDLRSDLYAVGILLYELLEKKRLFDGVNDLATLELVRESRLPSHALLSWPAPLRAAVLKSLQKNPLNRYQDAHQFLTDLNRFVLQEGLATDSLELSDYLRENFPKPQTSTIRETPVALETCIRPLFSKRIPRVLWGSISFLLLGMMTPGLSLKPKVDHSQIFKEKPATLKVAARPWGEVTIPGIVSREETPLNGLRLDEGKYRVRVHYPPLDQWAEKEIHLVRGSQVICQADFSSEGTIPKLTCY